MDLVELLKEGLVRRYGLMSFECEGEIPTLKALRFLSRFSEDEVYQVGRELGVYPSLKMPYEEFLCLVAGALVRVVLRETQKVLICRGCQAPRTMVWSDTL